MLIGQLLGFTLSVKASSNTNLWGGSHLHGCLECWLSSEIGFLVGLLEVDATCSSIRQLFLSFLLFRVAPSKFFALCFGPFTYFQC